MSNENEVDLYDDLDDITTLGILPHKQKKTNCSPKGGEREYYPGKEEGVDFFDKKYVEGLKCQIKDLQKENETLKRNIGTLYRTAKAEIERKDADNALLRENV